MMDTVVNYMEGNLNPASYQDVWKRFTGIKFSYIFFKKSQSFTYEVKSPSSNQEYNINTVWANSVWVK